LVSEARILAAGGLLWRDPSRRELCLVHRPRYDDWCLPKGKLDRGERFVEAVLREVREETGFESVLDTFAGELLYLVDGRAKTVLFWNLLPLGERPAGAPDPDEVDEVRWFAVHEALAVLTYTDERQLVADSAG
jgi:8-oxo-dGTP diphosphatase